MTVRLLNGTLKRTTSCEQVGRDNYIFRPTTLTCSLNQSRGQQVEDDCVDISGNRNQKAKPHMETTLSLYLLPALIAGALFLLPRAQAVSTFLTTLVHELGHGLVVLPFFPLGGRMGTIRIEATGEGQGTVSYPGYPKILGFLVRLINLLIGYASPLYVGFTLLLWTVNGMIGYAAPTLAVIALMGVLFVRGWFGWLSSLTLFIISIALLNSVSYDFITQVITFVAVTLIIGGALDLFNVAAHSFGFGEPLTETDFDIAAEELLWGAVSAQGWFIIFLALHTAITAVVFTPLLSPLMG